MTRKIQPFRRADGRIEVVVLSNFGLSNAYNSTRKYSHYIEDTEGDGSSIDPDKFYVQLDDGYTLPEYKENGVHILRNINVGDEQATYEHFAKSHDSDEKDDWIERKCDASDFPSLLNQNKLLPIKQVHQYVTL